MNKKRKLKVVFGSSLALLAAASVASCDKGSSEYKVSFNVKDPDTTDTITLDDIAPVTVKKGGTVDLTKYSLKYSGYTFGGWFTDEACTTEFTSATKVTKNLKLYAKWTKAVAKFKVTYVSEQGTAPAALNDVNALPSELPTLTADGYTFEGWFTDAECTKAAVAGAAISANTTLYAKWTAAAESSIDIPEGYEEVKANLDLATVVTALGAGKKFNDAAYTAGMFTIDQNKDLETRSRGKTWTKTSYSGFDYVDKYNDLDGNNKWTSTHSLKLVQAAGISFTTLGNGNCRVYVQNGSGSAGDSVYLTIKDKTADTSTDMAFPAASDGSPMVQVSFDVVEGHEYQVLRRDSGTIDLYKIELDMAVVKSAVTGISVVTPGKNKFIAGMDFTSAGLSVAAVKENGTSQAIDNADLTIDSSAIDFTTAGTYNVKVTYGTFEAEYPVTVYDLDDMELGFNKIKKLDKNTAAGNGQYYNLTPQQVYGLNDTIDGDGVTVIAYTSNDDYYERFEVDSKFVTVTGFDSSTTGEKLVTITLTMNGVSKSENVLLYVVDTPVATVKDSSDKVTEANVYVDPNYTGTMGAVTTVGAVSKECNTFKSIQQALDFLGMQENLDTVRKNVYIASGTYEEKIEITLPYLSLIGLGGANNTIITWDSLFGIEDEGGFSHVTDSTQTVAVRDSAINCIIDGISIKNRFDHISKYDNTPYENNGERALALLVQADKFVMQNGALYGWQDTLQTFTGRQYFKNTYICGCVDFIFGTNSTTYFDNCDIEILKSKASYTDDTKVSAYITAYKGQNKTAADKPTYGAVFNGCNFHAASDFVGKYAIARPWAATSTVAYLNCTFDNKLAVKESETIVTGLIKDVNINTLDIKFYNNKYTDNTAIALTDDLTNVDPAMTSEQVEKYGNKLTVFGVTTSGVVYDTAWDPSVTTVQIDLNTYYNFDGKSSATGTNYAYNYITSSATEKITTLGGLTIDGTNGKVDVRTANGDTQLEAGAKISLNVEANTKIVVSNYPSYYAYKVYGDVDTTVRHANADTVSYFFASAQKVTIEATGTVYLFQIKVMPNQEVTTPTLTGLQLVGAPAVEYAVNADYDLSTLVVKALYNDSTYQVVTDYSLDVSKVDKTKAGTYEVTVSYGGESEKFNIVYVGEVSDAVTSNTTFDTTYAGLTQTKYQTLGADPVEAGKFLIYAETKDQKLENKGTYFQFNEGTKITFKVKAGATVEVYGYSGNSNYSLTGSEAAATTDLKTATYTSDTTVEVLATGNKYLTYIKVTYPAAAISTNTTITFGTEGNYAASDSPVEVTGINTFNTNNSQFADGGTVKFKVAAGATVKVYGYGGSAGANDNSNTAYTVTVGAGQASSNQTGDYEVTVAEESEVLITSGNGNYLVKIEVTFTAA